jgi:small conductance mechanosensitive channel
MAEETVTTVVDGAAEEGAKSASNTLKETVSIPSTEEAAQWMETMQEHAMEYGIKIIAALVIFFVGRWIAGLIKGLIRRLLQKRKLDETVTGFVCNIAYVTLMVFVIIAAIGKLGVQTGSFIAIIGAAGLAIGLALQGSLANFAAGFLIILFRPFKKGDFIEAGGAAGIVDEIQVFTTILKTPDNKVIIIPNGGVLGGNITNYSAEATRRIEWVIGVSYTDNLKKVRDVLQSIVAADERIHKDPEPQIVVAEMADSSVNFKLRVWADTSDYWGVYFDITEIVKTRFDDEGISIPFPQRDVHLFQEKSA